jgi:hypothetical protein
MAHVVCRRKRARRIIERAVSAESKSLGLEARDGIAGWPTLRDNAFARDDLGRETPTTICGIICFHSDSAAAVVSGQCRTENHIMTERRAASRDSMLHAPHRRRGRSEQTGNRRFSVTLERTPRRDK